MWVGSERRDFNVRRRVVDLGYWRTIRAPSEYLDGDWIDRSLCQIRREGEGNFLLFLEIYKSLTHYSRESRIGVQWWDDLLRVAGHLLIKLKERMLKAIWLGRYTDDQVTDTATSLFVCLDGFGKNSFVFFISSIYITDELGIKTRP